MYPQRKKMMRQALGLGMLVSLVVLALSACGGGAEAGGQEEEARALTVPEQPRELRPGEYYSEEFKPPFSFRVAKGWTSPSELAPDYLQIWWIEEQSLTFMNVEKVYEPIYEPTETSSPKLVEAPEDLVGWFQNHPYLKTSKPEPVTVGGVEGQQFDVAAEEVPEDHLSICGAGCVDAIKGPSDKLAGPLAVYFEGDKWHAIVLEDVNGETVYIDYGGPAPEFDEVAPEAQKVLDSVKWGDS